MDLFNKRLQDGRHEPIDNFSLDHAASRLVEFRRYAQLISGRMSSQRQAPFVDLSISGQRSAGTFPLTHFHTA